MKIRLLVGIFTVSILSLGVIGMVYGSNITRALAVESQRYGGMNLRYVSVAVIAVVLSYSFGYLSTKIKLI